LNLVPLEYRAEVLTIDHDIWTATWCALENLHYLQAIHHTDKNLPVPA
jgi:hypothetical protein